MDFSQIYSFLMIENIYLKALTVFALFFICSELVVFISKKIFMRIAEKTKTDVDDRIVKKANKPISFILILIGLRIALGIMYQKEFLERIFISEIINTLLIIVCAYLIIVIFDIIIDSWGRAFAKRTKSKMDDQLLSLFHRFSKIVFFILAVLFILQAWGIKIGPLLTGLGIGGIAIAFAMQSSLANIFGGISMILDKNIKTGDVIQLDAKTKGTILDIGLRSTKMRNWDNEVIIVPNGKLADSTIQNLVQPDPTARATIDFGVVYGADHKKVKKVVLAALNKIPEILKDPEPKVMFINMGDFALSFRAFLWVESYDLRWATREKAVCAIYDALNKAKIGIPFPTQTVYLKKRK